MSPRPILIVVHQEDSTPGRVGELLRARGHTLDRRCPSIGDPLPVDLAAYDAAIVFGGPQSANDVHLPGIRAELEWLESYALASASALLGICLGAQLIARALGARVGPHPDGQVEIGYHEIEPTGRCERFLDAPAMFYQWHAESFDIPPDAVHLARNDAFPSQAFSYHDRVFGIEFHPEMTLDMINRWCTSKNAASKLARRGAQPHPQQVADFHRHRARTDRWLDAFLSRLLGAREA